MDIFAVFTMVGGLALFLYGMHEMGNGLTKLSGGRMEHLLEKLTSNRFMGVLLGLVVTAVIQSSSATTVMVVGFVNSGIMRLGQAVGIIMGANIGTTVTSWLLSLTGISGNSIVMRMLKPSSFSPILAVTGVILIMFSKKEKKRNIGLILIGFAILMFGMETMSGAVKPLAQNETFTNLFLMFTNPILGMLAGLVLTAIIQSSSASVGILQALCSTGIVSFGAALPIIMGQNIGTCVTALLSSIGTSRNAKRAAMVHLYFNLIGTTIFMCVFYLINAFADFAFLRQAATPFGIAVIHSLFNIGATIVLFPFGRQLEKLAILTIPNRKITEEEEAINEDYRRLDPRLLSRPSVALEQARFVTMKMAKLASGSILSALSMIENGYKEEKDERIQNLEKTVDTYEDKIGSYMVQISTHDLSAADSRMYDQILHNIGNFERITDHAVGIAEAFREMSEKKLSFSAEAMRDLTVMGKAVTDILHLSIDSFCDQNMEKARYAIPLEEVIDALSLEEKQRHIKRLQNGACTIELGFILADLTTLLERVSDHCRNIAVSTLQLEQDSVEMHGIKDIMEGRNNEKYHKAMAEMGARYALPA